MPVTYTPVRYPGGKSKIYPLVDSIIEGNGLVGCTYAEAFCGGAGLAMRLLLNGRVSRVLLNDLDPAVFSMWDAIVHRPDDLCRFLCDTEPTVGEWRRQREVLFSSDSPSFSLGCAAMFLNRVNRSGILRGGPIGGVAQTGKWRMDARYNTGDLCRKIGTISARSTDIGLYNMDGAEFIEDALPAQEGPVFANFDPPYVEKGPSLYANAFGEADHRHLAETIARCPVPWMVTYDADPLVDELYGVFTRYDLSVGYSAARVRVGREILVAGPGLRVSGCPGCGQRRPALDSDRMVGPVSAVAIG